jgi:hypothetical protein
MVVRNARDIAKQLQEDCIMAQQIANLSSNPEKIAKKIRSRDTMKEMWQSIPSSIKPHSTSSISMIKVLRNPSNNPKHPSTTLRTVLDPTEMESLLISRNQKHFSQAKETPLASTTISDTLGWGANQLAANSILKGTCDLASLTTDPHAQLIFKQCQC